MTNVDQFESVFRAADKVRFAATPPSFDRVLVVTDLDETDAYAFGEHLKQFLRILAASSDAIAWDIVGGAEFETTDALLDLIAARGPDLVCTYRHLGSAEWRSAYTLGDAVEALTQSITTPVLIVPHPDAKRDALLALQDTSAVMAMTDHLTGADRLVNVAAAFVEPNGTLFLTHVEDEVVFDRYIEIISRIPNLDTDTARQTIHDRLLREPRDYIESCREAFADTRPDLHVEPVVTMGRHLGAYRDLLTAHRADLLVMNTKDEDQTAMHGLAYPLAVEVRDTPLLML